MPEVSPRHSRPEPVEATDLSAQFDAVAREGFNLASRARGAVTPRPRDKTPRHAAEPTRRVRSSSTTRSDGFHTLRRA